MGKVKSFAAKMAHDTITTGRVICPVCNTEVKKIKMILNKKKGSGAWSPRYDFKPICKCNEADFFAGKAK